LCDLLDEIAANIDAIAEKVKAAVRRLRACGSGTVEAILCGADIIEMLGPDVRNLLNGAVSHNAMTIVRLSGGTCTPEAFGMTVCIAPALVPEGRSGTTYGSVFVARSFDPAVDNLLLAHESRHAYQWASGGAFFAIDYLREEAGAVIRRDNYRAETGTSVDSACFNAYEVDANTAWGGYEC